MDVARRPGSLTSIRDRHARSRRPAKSATRPPNARNGPSGIAIFRAAAPWRARSTTDGTSAASMPTISATGSGRPERRAEEQRELDVAHSEAARIGEGGEQQEAPRPPAAARSPTAASGRSRFAPRARTTAAGSTTRFGITRRSRSVTVTTTSVAQKTAETQRVGGEPEVEDAGRDEERRRQLDERVLDRDRRAAAAAAPAQEKVREDRDVVVPGDLACCRPGSSSAGATIESRTGIRAATTFRKLPIASPGMNASAATAPVMLAPAPGAGLAAGTSAWSCRLLR